MGNEVMKQSSLADIGQRLKNVRKKLGLQHTEITSTLQIEPGYLSDIESGKANPDADFFLKLANEYCVNPNYLLLGIGDMILETNRDISPEEILDTGIDSLEKLISLMEVSGYFKSVVFCQASKAIFEDSEIIRKSIQVNKFKNIQKNNKEQNLENKTPQGGI